jgi:hypothetical protein
VASNVLVGERGTYRPTTELAALELPDTVHAVLAGGWTAWRPLEKRLLQTAATSCVRACENVYAGSGNAAVSIRTWTG